MARDYGAQLRIVRAHEERNLGELGWVAGESALFEKLAEQNADLQQFTYIISHNLRAAGFELEAPRAALYLFPKVPASLGSDSVTAARALLDTLRVATVPGIGFVLSYTIAAEPPRCARA